METYCVLTLQQWRLDLRLGWTDAERETLQPVEIDIALRFPKPLPACETDLLEQTVCYDRLTTKLREYCIQTPFRLLEALGYHLYLEVRKHMTRPAQVYVRVRKVSAPVKGLAGGASFSYGDWSPGEFHGGSHS